MNLEDRARLHAEQNPFGYREITSGDLKEAWWSGFYMVEMWSDDDQRAIRLVHASNSLTKAREIFDAETRRRPGARYYLRQRARVLRKWPED